MLGKIRYAFLALVFALSPHIHCFDLKDEPKIEGVIEAPLPEISSQSLNCACVKKWASNAKKSKLNAIYEMSRCFIDLEKINQETPLKQGKCKTDNMIGAAWAAAGATRGHAPSMTLFGRLLQQGLGVEKNLVGAADWWAQASSQNYGPALFSLGEAYEKGMGRKVNPNRAKTLFEEAAVAGDAHAYQLIDLELKKNSKGTH